MSKTQTQLITDLKHTVSLLEALNNGNGGNRQFDNSKGLEAINKGLKKKLSGLSRSRGQYKSLWETVTKELNRLKTDYINISKLANSLKEEEKHYLKILLQCEQLSECNRLLELEVHAFNEGMLNESKQYTIAKENFLNKINVLEIENKSLREQNNTLNLALVDQHSVKS